MHLLARDLHGLDDAGAAVDLGQSPAEIVFLSFSDSELCLLARAHEQNAVAFASLRCASLARLKHPYSVDLYIENVARHARLVVVRLLGGKDYWPYGVEQLQAAARAKKFELAIVPGDVHGDARLTSASTLLDADLRRIWSYFQDGGPDNLRSFLGFAATRIGRSAPWRDSVPVASAGRCEAACRAGLSEAMRALIVFYRSAFLADDIAPIVALADALRARGFAVEAAFVASLKDGASEAYVARALDALRPDVIVNATAFSARGDHGGVLDQADAPVLQVALTTSSREAWEKSPRGANGADLAMNVVLPEVDGRIFTRAISFKVEAPARLASEFSETLHAPDLSRVDFVAELAANWARLRHKPNGEKSLALVLSDYPARRGRGGYAIGLDTPASVGSIVEALRGAGYDVGRESFSREAGEGVMRSMTDEGRAVAEVLHLKGGDADPPLDANPSDNFAGFDQAARTLIRPGYAGPPSPTSWEKERATHSRLMLSLEDGAHCAEFPIHVYQRLFESLPAEFAARVRSAWGEPEDDPAFRDGAFRFSCIENGKLVVALQPDRGARAQRRESYHDAELPPRHSYIAFYLWLRFTRRIDALIHLGTHGTLEWLPGKSVMLGADCAPGVVLGPTPLVYPFIVNDPGEAAQAKRRASAVTIGHLTPPLIEAELFDATEKIETLLDEYASAATLDPRRAKLIADAIINEAECSGLAAECGVTRDTNVAETLARLDAWLCDIKEMRIGDGLHVFGRAQGDDAMRDACARAEMNALLRALDGRFIEPGPAGAPSRGRADVLPTGRNLFCIDPRHVPTRTAYDIGRRAGREVMTRHAQEQGDWPRAILLDLWGSATIRTGGEDFAQALALLGVIPLWDHASARVSGFEIEPLAKREFPRVDVTLHISGLFRDMFPGLIALFHDAARAVALLDEDEAFNPLIRAGADAQRIFGAARGTYGLGLGETIARGEFSSREELANGYLDAAGHAYDRAGESAPARETFAARVCGADALVHIQDMAEADVLTGSAFAEFEGGFAAANRALGGTAELVHLDATRPDSLRARSLETELARVIRARLANPDWLEGQMRHGHRGAGEIAEAIDNLFAFAATSGLVGDAQFDLVFFATLGKKPVRDFLARENPRAFEAIAHVFEEALRRGLWRTRRNSVVDMVTAAKERFDDCHS
jgi:cobaltochelatase CobN